MRLINKNVIEGSSLGDSPEVIPVDPNYTQTAITINSLNTGTAIFRAKVLGSDGFENVEGGVLDLTVEKTLVIGSNDKGNPLESIEITTNPLSSFDYSICQH